MEPCFWISSPGGFAACAIHLHPSAKWSLTLRFLHYGWSIPRFYWYIGSATPVIEMMVGLPVISG